MLMHGENDNDVPIAEAEQFYIGLRDVGTEAVMVRYPREGHGIRESKHVVDSIDRSIRWYEHHFPRPSCVARYPGRRACSPALDERARRELSGDAAIADAVLWGKEMPASALTAGAADERPVAADGVSRARAQFRSAITPPPGATDEERPPSSGASASSASCSACSAEDSAKVASLYALDVDIEPDWQGMPEMPRREAKFIDDCSRICRSRGWRRT